jgi:hypothetical protein
MSKQLKNKERELLLNFLRSMHDGHMPQEMYDKYFTHLLPKGVVEAFQKFLR